MLTAIVISIYVKVFANSWVSCPNCSSYQQNAYNNLEKSREMQANRAVKVNQKIILQAKLQFIEKAAQCHINNFHKRWIAILYFSAVRYLYLIATNLVVESTKFKVFWVLAGNKEIPFFLLRKIYDWLLLMQTFFLLLFTILRAWKHFVIYF